MPQAKLDPKKRPKKRGWRKKRRMQKVRRDPRPFEAFLIYRGLHGRFEHDVRRLCRQCKGQDVGSGMFLPTQMRDLQFAFRTRKDRRAFLNGLKKNKCMDCLSVEVRLPDDHPKCVRKLVKKFSKK